MSVSLLAALFVTLFAPNEMRIFLARLGGDHDVRADISWGDAPNSIAFSVAEALDRRGKLDQRLFDALVDARGGRREEIEVVRASCLGSGPVEKPAAEAGVEPGTSIAPHGTGLAGAAVRGFLSYPRKLDEHVGGRLSAFREKLQGELQVRGLDAELFQDEVHITWGADWRARLRSSLEQAHFLVPILAPIFFERPWCREEVLCFKRHRPDHVYPVLWIESEQLADTTDEVGRFLATRQYADWTALRFEKPDSSAWARSIAELGETLAKRVGRSGED